MNVRTSSSSFSSFLGCLSGFFFPPKTASKHAVLLNVIILIYQKIIKQINSNKSNNITKPWFSINLLVTWWLGGVMVSASDGTYEYTIYRKECDRENGV